ncbi:hypothetical protein OG21DRAFT_1518540 [Imleria badia]|nr:hypothetical protein OG21DRAFT_1518540 [Imleria badia]
MPAVQPPAKVLVSGATRYIAAWVMQNLLERGYAVRGTARSVAKVISSRKRLLFMMIDSRLSS